MLEVRAVPSQAYVYLDGTPIGDASRSRDRNIRINGITPGEHTVGIYNYGYKPEVQKVTIVEGKIEHLRVHLTPINGTVSGPWGRIQIEGGRHGAVLLNGKSPEYLVGHADEFNNERGWKQELLVPPGTHQLTVLDRDTVIWSGPVTVAANQRVVVHVNKNGEQKSSNWPRGEKLSNLPRFEAKIASATVAVAKPTAQISAASTEVKCGGTAHLSWSSTDAVQGQISGVGEVAASGERDIQPKDTTTYTYTATGPGGAATSSATVNVDKTVQASLEVSPPEVRYEGVGSNVVQQGTATVTWTTSNADSVSIEPFGKVDPTGSRSVQATANQTVSGPVNETRTYVLSASNACGGSVTRTATLRVVGSIKPAIAEFTEAMLVTRLASVYFPTAYPLKKVPGVGLVRSQRDSLLKLADGLKKYLEVDPQARIRLEGNADKRGAKKYNEVLSERRVDIVKQFLISAGIPTAAIDTTAFGKDKNLDRAGVRELEQQNPEKPPVKLVGKRLGVDWLAHNRRVDIVLLPGGQTSIRFYPYAAGEFKILWQAPRPPQKKVEAVQ
ncbi:MAG: OmpA family protein [Acidobacteriia bacterium]|nr:OmpA family protein [Terriglobia bacterium]